MKEFKSKLAQYMIAAINEKRNNGYSYQEEERAIKDFDTFIIKNNLDTGEITREIIMKYGIQRHSESNNSRQDRLIRINSIARYMNSLGINAYISHNYGTRDKPIPYLPSKDQLHTFFIFVDNFKIKNKPYNRFLLEYSVIFRLYYCCGLRRSEALHLKIDDVDLKQGTLTIVNSKRNKSRIVYMDESVRQLCIKYNQSIIANYNHEKYFFPGQKATMPLSTGTINTHFRFYWEESQPQYLGKMPTVQSLRHCFITYKIDEWQASGVDVDSMIPYLSKYVGHSNIQQTYYYYHSLDARSLAVRNLVNKSNEAIPEVIKYEE